MVQRTLLVIFLLAISKHSFSQAKISKPIHTGVGAGISISGSGYGAFYDVYLSLSKGKNNITIGPSVQKRSGKLGAGKITYSYVFAARDDEGTMIETSDYKSSDVLQVGVFSYLQYAHDLPLGYHRVKNETMADTNKQFNWNDVKISTLEGGAGLELFVRLGARVRWRTFAGFCAYYHAGYNERMYQERSGVVLAVGTSLNFMSFRRSSSAAIK